MQLAHSRVNSPSGVVSPNPIPRCSCSTAAMSFAPAISQLIVRQSRMTYVPATLVPRKE